LFPFSWRERSRRGEEGGKRKKKGRSPYKVDFFFFRCRGRFGGRGKRGKGKRRNGGGGGGGKKDFFSSFLGQERKGRKKKRRRGTRPASYSPLMRSHARDKEKGKKEKEGKQEIQKLYLRIALPMQEGGGEGGEKKKKKKGGGGRPPQKEFLSYRPIEKTPLCLGNKGGEKERKKKKKKKKKKGEKEDKTIHLYLLLLHKGRGKRGKRGREEGGVKEKGKCENCTLILPQQDMKGYFVEKRKGKRKRV